MKIILYTTMNTEKYKRLEIKIQQNSSKQDTSQQYIIVRRGILDNTDEENKRDIY